MARLIALCLILAGCASAADRTVETLNAMPSNVTVCGELDVSNSTITGTTLPIEGRGALKYIRLPQGTPLENLTPELIQTLEQTICP